jgi:phosphoglycolate phosphatase
MKPNRAGIAFDLDGTLLDYKARYYATFRDALKPYGICCPDADFLFRTRRQTGDSRKVLTKILQRAHKKLDIVDECLKNREAIIENWPYLELDSCFSGVKDALQRLKNEGFVLSVITLRKNKDFVMKILEKEGLLSFFEIVLTRNDTPEKDSKAGLLRKFIDNFSLSNCFYIGDSIEDIKVGKKAGVKTIAVLSGVEEKRTILKENPDLIISGVAELSAWIVDNS